jgi:hypothetical protein
LGLSRLSGTEIAAKTYLAAVLGRNNKMRRRQNMVDTMLKLDEQMWKKKRWRMLDEVTMIEESLQLWPLSRELEMFCSMEKRPKAPKPDKRRDPPNGVFWMRRRANLLSEIDNIERMVGQYPRLAALRKQWNNGGV